MNEMTILGVGKMANLRVWSQRVAECRESGLPVSRWYQENGINVKMYYNWQKVSVNSPKAAPLGGQSVGPWGCCFMS